MSHDDDDDDDDDYDRIDEVDHARWQQRRQPVR
jgi:hypothetical protein